MNYLASSSLQLVSLTFAIELSHDAIQSFRCELTLDSNELCPTDGGWSVWTSWGPCIGECGFRGKRIKSRMCNNPFPSNSGAPCIGAGNEIEICQVTGCTMNDYEQAIHANPIREKEMKVLKAIHNKLPALKELCFSIDCSFPIVEKILGSNAMIYWNAMNCIKYNVGCPIPGGWSHWGAWSSCTALCGKGKVYRVRNCDSPSPSGPELSCDGIPFEAKSCTGFDCKKHSVGTWSNWSSWDKCSSPCGSGIKLRRRSCIENEKMSAKQSIAQGTSCEGPLKEIKYCKIDSCSINGAWSSWTIWTPCSSNCGVGTQFRNRMCNNPFPQGSGAACSGLASEIRQCFTKPCFVKTHEVAYFTGESTLFYTMAGKLMHLLHVYLRFLPLSPFGELFYRYQDNCIGSICNFVKLFMKNGKIILLAEISGCTFDLVHDDKMKIGVWHEIMVLISGSYAMLQVDEGSHKSVPFSCIPVLRNLDHLMKIGDKFHGQIQRMAINFAPLELHLSKSASKRGTEHLLYSTNYVQYLMGDDDEGFLHISQTESLATPCPKSNVTFVLKSERVSGIIAIIPGYSANKYILLLLDEGRVKLKFCEDTTCAVIESAHHNLIGEWFELVIIYDGQHLYLQVNGNDKNYVPSVPKADTMSCNDNMFIGALYDEIQGNVCSQCRDIPQMSFTLGYLNIDNIEIDLLSLPALETENKRFASRTISFSDYYTEQQLLLGQELKLSCFYNKIDHNQRKYYTPLKDADVMWLLVDSPLHTSTKATLFAVKDDGRISSIRVASYTDRKEIETFYSCYIRRYKNISIHALKPVIFTFGVIVIDGTREFGNILWREWSYIYCAIIIFLLTLLAWCFLEGFLNIRYRYGFYRLAESVDVTNNMSVVNFILSKDGITLLGSQQAAKVVVTKVVTDNQIQSEEIMKNKVFETDS